MTEKACLSAAYFGNIQYFSKFLIFEKIIIEQHDHYLKQSYRNRCIIYGANGPLTLVIPVKKDTGKKVPVKDVLIDYDIKWQHQHWISIHSAYKNSPFFDFYEDDFHPFFTKKEKYLLDLDLKTTDLILKLLKLNQSFEKSSEYSHNLPDDYRESISPKPRLSKPDQLFSPKWYHQVFTEKFGFLSNLSTMDLLFNEGPCSMKLIRQSVPGDSTGS